MIETFKSYLENRVNKYRVISIFLKAKSNLNEHFAQIIEEYYNSINFGDPRNKNDSFEYSTILFGSFGNLEINLTFDFFISKIEEYLSNSQNRESFNPWSLNLLKYFERLNKNLQQDIINLLIKKKRYNAIMFSLRREPRKFSEYINQFLEIRSDNENDIRSLLSIFKLIIRNFNNDNQIFNKLKERLFQLPNTYDKGLFLSFIGERKEALKCFEEILDNEISLSQKMFILLDAILEYLDIYRGAIPIHTIRKIEEDLDNLGKEFGVYNIIKESHKKFPFKFNFVKARFMLYLSIHYINLDNYQKSSHYLSQSEKYFTNLSNSKNIPSYNKEIIIYYNSITTILESFTQRIKTLKNENNITTLNQELREEVSKVAFKHRTMDIKIENIKRSIESFRFNKRNLNQLRIESPLNFCPLPPPITSIYIRSITAKKKIYPWNSKLELVPLFKSIQLSEKYQQFEIIQKFARKERKYCYILEFEQSDLIDVFKYKPVFKAGKNQFRIDIRSNGFYGNRVIHFKLKPNDICLVGIELELLVKDLEIHINQNISDLALKQRFFPFLNKKDTFIEEIDHDYCSELGKEINTIKEKCSRNASGKDCEACFNIPTKICLTKLFSKPLGLDILPHSGSELADCYWISENEGYAVVLKATKLNTTKQYSDPYMQVSQLSQKRTVKIIFFANSRTTSRQFLSEALNLCEANNKRFIIFSKDELIQFLHNYKTRNYNS
ncbi:MAG: hypothetical protein GF311_24155 [Candidatus Lokiarchaeota archaeon]|nr:hypothetical protein [Candidatus Lokiarchaeota archaeon]